MAVPDQIKPNAKENSHIIAPDISDSEEDYLSSSSPFSIHD
jgi:hypothetical protein